MKVNPLKYPLIITLCMSFPVLKAKVSDIKLCCVKSSQHQRQGEMLTSLTKEYGAWYMLKESQMLS